MESHNINVCLLPPNATDLLPSMDISVSKPAKDYMKRQFEESYSEKVMKQLEGKDRDDLETTEIQSVNLSMQILKQVRAKLFSWNGRVHVCVC